MENRTNGKRGYIVEVEKGKNGVDGGTPSVGSVYRSIYAKDGFPEPADDLLSCWDIFRLRSHLGSLGVTGNLALQPMYTLSVAFAKITFKKPHLLLLDEPSNHLDLDAVEALIQGLLVLFQGGICMVSHDEHLISGSVDELWVVSDDRIAPFHGTFHDYKKLLQSSS